MPGRFEGQLGLDRISWMIMIYNACDVIFVCIKSFFFLKHCENRDLCIYEKKECLTKEQC